MIRRGRLARLLIGCCLLLGGSTIAPVVPGVMASVTSSRTVPGQLTTKFPLGSQRLCCQSTSHSRTAAAPASGATGAGAAGAVAAGAGATGARNSGAGSSGGAPGASAGGSSGGMPAVIWIGLGAAVTALLAAGVARVPHGRRRPVPTQSPRLRVLPAVAHAMAVPRPAPVIATGFATDETRYRRLDEDGDAGAAFNLGVLLHARGDVAAATAAYERAEERGDTDAAFNLGVLLYEIGDLAAAQAAWLRSVERGNARAAANLIFLAHRHRAAVPDEPDGDGQREVGEGLEMVDELVFRRADERGGARGAFNLGVVLHQRGDAVGAMAAYRRAERRGDPDAAFNLGVLQYEAGDLDGAESSWRRGVQRGDPRATENLEYLVRQRSERKTTGAGRTGGTR